MRSQGCTIHQALTAEAAAVVKQAVVLAKRRGHAQVTPLHVAHTMLTVSSGLLRASCIQAHSHPLQCRALELCFNVALNRLPTSTSGPMLGHHHHHHPTIANALVAAFKRAQAHQRRGFIENQQQPLLAVKIEVEQLIISILDDPSVSRVMREAGFSSTLVKAKVEEATSMDLGTQNQPPTKPNYSNSNSNTNTNLVMGKPRNEDVMSVVGSLRSMKKNSVVVGECIETLGGIVREVMDRCGDDEGLKFIQLSLSSFAHLSREEFEVKLGELKFVVKSSCMEGSNKGVVLYLGDLKWATNEFIRANNILGEQYQPRRNNSYFPINNIIMEIQKLISGYSECGKLWILGIATFQTFMRCKCGQPSIETAWGLQSITIPSGTLSLSLLPDSDQANPLIANKKTQIGGSWLMLEGGGGGGLVDSDVRSRQSSACNSESTNSSLPPWLQQYKDENSRRATNSIHNDQDTMPIKDAPQNWGSICTSSPHTQSPSSSSFERTLSFSSISPSSSTSNFSYDHPYLKLQPTHQGLEPKKFWVNEPTLTLHNNGHPHQQKHSSYPTSPSSSDIIMDQMEAQCGIQRFKEYNAENLKTLCDALEQKAPPDQKDISMEIATIVLHCRSRMAPRKGDDGQGVTKEETWLFFQGADMDAKEKIARELARLIFGSQDKFVPIGLSSFSSTSLEDSRNKRLRDEQSCSSYNERFANELSRNPHRVFFIEDIDQVDYSSQMGIKKAIQRGRIRNHASGEEVSLGDSIIILSCESFRSRSRACSPSTKHKVDVLAQEKDQNVTNKVDGSSLEENMSPSISLDLNISINDNEEDDEEDCRNQNGFQLAQLMDQIGLLASVDRCITFKNHQN